MSPAFCDVCLLFESWDLWMYVRSTHQDTPHPTYGLKSGVSCFFQWCWRPILPTKYCTYYTYLSFLDMSFQHPTPHTITVASYQGRNGYRSLDLLGCGGYGAPGYVITTSFNGKQDISLRWKALANWKRHSCIIPNGFCILGLVWCLRGLVKDIWLEFVPQVSTFL